MRLRWIVALTAALSLGLAGCSSQPNSSAASGDQVDRTIVIGVGGEPSNLNPVFGDIYGSVYGDHWPVFSSLLDYGQDLELQPDLAAELPEVSTDGTEVTVKVRDDARWHDGEPVTAADVAFTYNAILDPSVATPVRDLLFRSLRKVDALDAETARFTLHEPDQAFLAKLTTGIVPEHVLAGQDLNKAAFNLAPVGSGPFVFDELRPGERIVLTANPDYYGGEVGLERVVVTFVEDESARVRQLETGALDVDAEGLGPQTIRRFEDNPDYRVVRIPGDLLTLTLPTTNAFFKQAEVRRAIGKAIDRQQLVDGLAAGAGRVVSGPFYPDHWATDPSVSVAYDPDAARAELAAHGWKPGPDGVLVRDGERFRFDLIYGHGYAEDAAALAIRDALGNIGIEVKPKALDYAEQQKQVAAGAASLQGLGNAYDPAIDVFDTYHSSLSDDDPSGNVARVESRRIDAAIERGERSNDLAERTAAYHELHRLLVEHGSWQYLMQGDNYYAVRADVSGVEPQVREGHVHGFSRGLLWNLADWSVSGP